MLDYSMLAKMKKFFLAQVCTDFQILADFGSWRHFRAIFLRILESVAAYPAVSFSKDPYSLKKRPKIRKR